MCLWDIVLGKKGKCAVPQYWRQFHKNLKTEETVALNSFKGLLTNKGMKTSACRYSI